MEKVRELLAELRYLGAGREELLALVREAADRPMAGGRVSAEAETGTKRQEEQR